MNLISYVYQTISADNLLNRCTRFSRVHLYLFFCDLNIQVDVFFVCIPNIMIILLFFLLHWFLSLFSQTFFLHRYASHKMFKMNRFWEKFFLHHNFSVAGVFFFKSPCLCYPAPYAPCFQRYRKGPSFTPLCKRRMGNDDTDKKYLPELC